MTQSDPVTHRPATIGEDFQDGLPAPLSPRDLLSRWLGALTRLVRARYGALGIMRQDGTFLELVRSAPSESRLARPESFLARPDVNCALLRRHRPIRVNGLMREPGDDACSPDDVPTGSFLGIPLAAHGSLVGLAYLAGKEIPGGFTPTDELSAEIAADALAPTLDRTRLLQHLAAQQERREGDGQ